MTDQAAKKSEPARPIERVYLGLPCTGNLVNEGVVDAVACGSKQGLIAAKQVVSYSILTQSFNILWANALNHRKKGITHFAMLHSDIGPEVGWLDKMVALMNEHGADVLSAISPIKSPHGLTSTALDGEKMGVVDWYWRPRRLTMTEIHQKYPGTFTHENLLLNTGCMLVDIRKPWVEQICFRFENAMLPHPFIEGALLPACVPEDWAFSRDAKKLGAKLFATREVKLYHEGTIRYSNDIPWGDFETDQPENGL